MIRQQRGQFHRQLLAARRGIRDHANGTQQHQHFRQLELVQWRAGGGERGGGRGMGVDHHADFGPDAVGLAVHVEFRGGITVSTQLPALHVTQDQIAVAQSFLVRAVTRADEEVFGDSGADVPGESDVILPLAEVPASSDHLTFRKLAGSSEIGAEIHMSMISGCKVVDNAFAWADRKQGMAAFQCVGNTCQQGERLKRHSRDWEIAVGGVGPSRTRDTAFDSF